MGAADTHTARAGLSGGRCRRRIVSGKLSRVEGPAPPDVRRLTEAVRLSACGMARAGLLPSRALTAIGVAPSRAKVWLHKGRLDQAAGIDSPESRLVEDLERAAGEVELLCSRRILEATEDDWRAARAYLDAAARGTWATGVQVSPAEAREDASPIAEAELESALAELERRCAADPALAERVRRIAK